MEKQNPLERVEIDAMVLDLVVHFRQEQLAYSRPTLVCQRDPVSGRPTNVSIVDIPKINEQNDSSLQPEQTPF